MNVGDTVVFQNTGGSHTVTGTGADPFCGNNAVPASCSVTFNTPGIFPYRCLFHSTGGANPSGMVGSITVQDSNNPPPLVNLTAPANGSSFPAPANITITAAASDPGGSVTKVEFFEGLNKLGEDLNEPFSYSWNNVQTGTYTLTARATDNQGLSTTSAPISVTVTVVNTVRVLRIVDTSGSVGGRIEVPVELVSQGDENAAGFSIQFEANRLAFTEVKLGAAASGATLTPNPAQAANGRLGLALSLPAGQSFAAGVRQLVLLTFDTLGSTEASTVISFGDTPVIREVSAVDASELPANYASGTVTLTAGYEADVTPRPSGNNSVTVTDWVFFSRPRGVRMRWASACILIQPS